MKKITSVLTLLLFTVFAFAQKQYDVQEGEKSMYKGSYTALSMTFEGVSAKAAAEEWKQFIKTFKGKTKEDKKGKVWFTDDAKMEKVSDNTIDLYTSFAETPGGTNVSVWFDLGGAYLSSAMDLGRTDEAKNILQDYGHAISKRLAKDNWDMEEKSLTMMQKDLKKMEGEQSSIQKEIEEVKSELLKLEAEAQQNRTRQQNQLNVIKTQEKAIEMAKALYKKH